jgi:hypothetical protein
MLRMAGLAISTLDISELQLLLNIDSILLAMMNAIFSLVQPTKIPQLLAIFTDLMVIHHSAIIWREEEK